MKKAILIALCMLLVASAAGCSSNKNNNTASSSISSSLASSLPETSAPEAEKEVFRKADDNVEMEVLMVKPSYTHQEYIGLTVKITNIGNKEVAYAQGSGSNTVPDAIQVTLGNLVGVYMPEISTNDYQAHVLNPGESIEYSTPFVPYAYANADTVVPIPPESPMEFFQSDKFSLVPAGKLDGTVTFTYAVTPSETNSENAVEATESAMEESRLEEPSIGLLQSGEVTTLQLPFSVELTEA